MSGVTRSQFAGALRDRYGVGPSADRELVGDLWKRYGDGDITATLDDIIGLAEPVVLAVQHDRQNRALANDLEYTEEVDFSPALGDVSPSENGLDSPSQAGREWVGHRISAFSEYLSKILATDGRVVGFRKRALGSPTATLTPEQAELFVHSPAAAYLPFTFFEEYGLSLVDHEATTESYEVIREDGGGFHRATVRIEPGRILKKAESEDSSQEGAIELLPWPGLDGGEYATHIRVWSNSVLGGLQRLGKRLSDKHPWGQDQAVNFVLTGAPQIASTLKGKTRRTVNSGVAAHKYNTQSITLEVAHWVPAAEVTQAYRKLQREVHDGSKSRKPSDRNIAIFRHVVSQSRVKVKSANENLARLQIPKWRDMLKLWNKKYPPGSGWHYEGEHHKGVQRFQRDFKRGQLLVIGHYVGLPGDPAQPMTRAEQRVALDSFKHRLAGNTS